MVGKRSNGFFKVGISLFMKVRRARFCLIGKMIVWILAVFCGDDGRDGEGTKFCVKIRY